MKSFKSCLAVIVFTLFAVNAFADCLATKADCQKAWDLKTKAFASRDSGDFDTAAKLFMQAADAHPQEIYKASYLMNAIGCELSSRLDPKGNYSWDSKKGPTNAQGVYALLANVQYLLDTVKKSNCVYKAGIVSGIQSWHDAQLKWLSSQVPQGVAVSQTPTVK